MNKTNSIWIGLGMIFFLTSCSGGQADGPQTKNKTLGTFRLAQSCEEVTSYARSYSDRSRQYPNKVVPLTQPVAAIPSTQPSGPALEGNAPAADAGAVTQSDIAFPDAERGLLFTLDLAKHLKIFRVSPAAQTQLLATVSLDFYPSELVTLGAQQRYYAVLFGSSETIYGGGVVAEAVVDPGFEEPKTVMALFDVTDPQQPTLVKEETAPGVFLEARALTGQTKVVWVTQRFVPIYLEDLKDSQILPDKTVRNGASQEQAPLTPCNQTLLYDNPTLDPGYSSASLNETVVALLDLGGGQPSVSSQALYAPAWRTLLAANPAHLFLAQNVDGPERTDTELYQFDLQSSSSVLALSAAAAVPGEILNQFFIDEKNEVLRVFHHVQTIQPVCLDACVGGQGGGAPGVATAAMKVETVSEKVGNYLSTYKQNGTNLDLLGRSGPFEAEESPYAARFVGTLGCVITYRQIDPLTCFSLQDPAQPTKVGSLEIAGVSFHLETITDNLLLGIGQGKQNSGVVANLFDISNPAQPNLAAQRVLSSQMEWASSPVFYDYRALGVDSSRRNFAVPIDHSTGTAIALFSVDPGSKQILGQGLIQKTISPDGSYDSYQRAYFFDDTMAALSYQELEVLLRSDGSSIFSSPLTN